MHKTCELVVIWHVILYSTLSYCMYSTSNTFIAANDCIWKRYLLYCNFEKLLFFSPSQPSRGTCDIVSIEHKTTFIAAFDCIWKPIQRFIVLQFRKALVLFSSQSSHVILYVSNIKLLSLRHSIVSEKTNTEIYCIVILESSFYVFFISTYLRHLTISQTRML